MEPITLQKKQDEIQLLLQGSQEPHLADCIDLIPTEHIISLYDMVCFHRKNNVYTRVIKDHLTIDIAAILEGRPDNAIYSKPFFKN